MCNNKVGDIPIVGPFISKPARLIPMAIGAGGSMAGIGPTMTNLMSTGAGLLQGGTTGLWGQPGASSMLKGGAVGFGTGMVGRGVGTGLQTQFEKMTAMPQNQPNIANFGQGFSQGFSEAVPFKNQINSLLGKQFFGTQSGANPFTANGGQQPPIGMGGTTTPKTASKGTDLVTQAVQQAGQQATQKRLTDYLLPLSLTSLGYMQKQPEYNVPSAVDTFSQLRGQGQQLLAPISPEGQLAAQKLQEYIKNPQAVAAPNMTAYKDSVTQNYEAAKQRELNYVNTRFNEMGLYGGSDWQKAVSDINEKYTRLEGEALGDVDRQIWQTQVSAHLDSISQSYQMDKQNLEALAGLTNMSIYEASIKYGLKAQEVADFRNALYSLSASTFPRTQSSSQLSGLTLKVV